MCSCYSNYSYEISSSPAVAAGLFLAHSANTSQRQNSIWLQRQCTSNCCWNNQRILWWCLRNDIGWAEAEFNHRLTTRCSRHCWRDSRQLEEHIVGFNENGCRGASDIEPLPIHAKLLFWFCVFYSQKILQLLFIPTVIELADNETVINSLTTAFNISDADNNSSTAFNTEKTDNVIWLVDWSIQLMERTINAPIEPNAWDFFCCFHMHSFFRELISI